MRTYASIPLLAAIAIPAEQLQVRREALGNNPKVQFLADKALVAMGKAVVVLMINREELWATLATACAFSTIRRNDLLKARHAANFSALRNMLLIGVIPLLRFFTSAGFAIGV